MICLKDVTLREVGLVKFLILLLHVQFLVQVSFFLHSYFHNNNTGAVTKIFFVYSTGTAVTNFFILDYGMM
jgi:heme/copper-type cytochrome/quinol oxidase subunit 4